MSYEEELAAGQADLRAKQFARARMHFGRAHGLGREVRCRHVMAHRGLFDVAVRTLDVKAVATQAFLIGATYLFERPARG